MKKVVQMKISQKTRTLLVRGGVAVAGVLLTTAAMAAAPSASAVNSEAQGISTFVIDMLNGWVGYLLALMCFFYGIFEFFKPNGDKFKMIGAFVIAVMIIIVPPTLEGFFSGAV